MSHVKMFSARYSDETTIYNGLRKLFPMTAGVSVTYQRGRFVCTTPRELTRDEISAIRLSLKANHYGEDDHQ